MRKLFSLIILMTLSLITPLASGSDVSNFFTPYGFRAPLLKQGQFALNFNPHYDREESELNAPSYDILQSETVWRQYDFSLSGVYALTDDLLFGSSLIFYPGQRRLTSWYVWGSPYSDLTAEWKMKEHSDFMISPVVGLSFRPQVNVEFHWDFQFSKDKSFYETEDEERFRNLKGEEIYFDLGFTLLGHASAEKITTPAHSQLLNFLRPYGFRAPVLDRGQYALGLDFFYLRSESSWDQSGGSEWEKRTWRRDYFSLNGLYAATERLLFQGGLEIYPGQTQETYDRVGVGSMWDYTKMRSDFTVSPNLVLSLRPKASMEVYGTFRFIREDLHKDTEFGFERDEKNDIYYISAGYTVLGNVSSRTSAPMTGLDFSDFFTPYGFRTPLLKQGQYALSIGSHYRRIESEEDYPSSRRDSQVRSIGKTYYFSLNGVYAVTGKLILEGVVSLYPGQTRLTEWEPWFDPYHEVTWEIETKQRSDFVVSPGFEISLRPRRNAELYGSFYFNKEKSHDEVSGERSDEQKSEGFYFNLGFTLLGNL